MSTAMNFSLDLNGIDNALKSEPPVALTVTERAKAHIKRELAKSPGAVGFRIGVVKSGCSGFAYNVELVDQAVESDRVLELDEDLTIFVDGEHYTALAGMRVDYVREGLSSMLKFENPNVVSECGCGESFSVS